MAAVMQVGGPAVGGQRHQSTLNGPERMPSTVTAIGGTGTGVPFGSKPQRTVWVEPGGNFLGEVTT